MEGAPYAGTGVLMVLENSLHYQQFFADLIDDLVRRSGSRSLLDFGAGIGTYSRVARAKGYDVTCLEIDDDLRAGLDADGFVCAKSLTDLSASCDRAIFSFNVLEHIDDDEGVLADLCAATMPGGWLLLVVPAFPILFSGLDRLVGHHRRYRRRELLHKVTAAGWQVERCTFVDSLGFFASLAYRLAGPLATGDLRPGSVRAYDRLVFPLSRALDPLCHRIFGKNLVVYARRPPEAHT